MTYKEQLKFLIHEYNNECYSTKDFCDQFTLIYNHYYRKSDTLAELDILFNKINLLAERYSPYQEDVENSNGFFIDEEDFKQKFKNIQEENHFF